MEIDHTRFQALQQSNLLKLRLNGNPLGEAGSGAFLNRLSVEEFGAVPSWHLLNLRVSRIKVWVPILPSCILLC